MTTRTRTKPFCIGIYFNRKNKASREQVSGIFRFAGEHPDWELHLFTRPDTPSEMRRMTESFAPDGIITGHPAIVDAFNARLGRHLPYVLIDYPAARSPASGAIVRCNDHEIGAHAATIFLKRGYKSFAFAGILGGAGNPNAANSKNRQNGFCRVLKNAGYDCATYHEQLDRNCWHYKDTPKLLAWLKALPKPCAILAHSDFLAQSVLMTCRKMRIALPSQIAVIGVDNEEAICESTTPKISSIEPDFAGGGYLAASMLDRLLRGQGRAPKSPRATYGILRTKERMSTQNVTGAHLRVAKALEIIHSEASAGLRTADIAARLGISERMLEITLHKTCGHSAREELLAFKLANAKTLLTSTEKPLDEIAADCGFRTLSALKALFKKKVGCSMRAYRRTSGK